MFKNIHLSYYFFSQEDGIMYHFDREYNRRNTECVKWDVMSEDIPKEIEKTEELFR